MLTGRSLHTSIFILGLLGSYGCSDDVTVVQLDPQLEVSPTVVDFGQVRIGDTKEIQVTISNPGEAVLELAEVTATELDGSFEFETTSLRVREKSAATLIVRFNPTEVGEKTGTLTVRPSPGQPKLTDISLSVTGVGALPQVEIEPKILSFGNVVVQSTKTIPITVRNSGTVDAEIEFQGDTNIRSCLSVGDPSVFCYRATPQSFGTEGKFTLAPGDSNTINVSFTPVIAGTRERGSFTLKTCKEEACVSTIRMDGIGIQSGFRCDPDTLAFGQVNPGSCLTKSVSCENIANEMVTVVNWGPSRGAAQPTSEDFQISEFTQPTRLNEGDTVSVDVTYCPQELGNDNGNVVIETDNPDPSRKFVTIPLSGTGGGPDISCTPANLNFGRVSLIAPARRTVLCQNVGFSDLTITEVLMDTAGTNSFTAPGAAATTVEAGGLFQITVEFQPRVEGPITSTMIVKSSDQDEPEVSIVLQGEGVNLPPCSFEIRPENLSFGVVERGRTASRSFEIRNTGASDCLVTSARLVPGSDMEFSLPDGDVMSLTIAPGSATTIRAEYAPDAVENNSGGIEFSISSPRSPFNTVQLTGSGADASLLIVPRELNFGTIGVGCAARSRVVTIYNTGTSPATIDAIELAAPANPAFSIASVPAPLPSMPLSLSPGGSTTFEVGFRADAISSYAGAVEISGTFGGNPVTYIVSLEGRGATDATQVDEFDQLGRPKVDILFVIDDSCSMSEEQTSLSSNFQAFIQFATAQQIDYQIGVTTTDIDEGNPAEAGRLVPISGNPADRIVTPRTQPSPETVFSMNANIGIDSTFTEKGLEGAYLALSNPLIFQHNAGFLRPDAVLSIIFVSDEEDQSPRAVPFYINFFLSIKGFRNTNLFTASSIVGDTPSGCGGSAGSAQAGSRYVEVANRTGGVFQSICTADWSRALEDLSTTAFGFKSRYFLTNQPVISSIKVFIDGVEVMARTQGGTVNWTYDFATNSINFSPFATPEPGAHIRVEYAAECL